MRSGQPFEIIDGDHFCYSEKFLDEFIEYFGQEKKIYVISVLGPKNSGKSTLLNFLFGCLFSVSDGRCTRGIYGTLMKSKIQEYDYFLIIDTESF